jgi:hypothetical protein
MRLCRLLDDKGRATEPLVEGGEGIWERDFMVVVWFEFMLEAARRRTIMGRGATLQFLNVPLLSSLSINRNPNWGLKDR